MTQTLLLMRRRRTGRAKLNRCCMCPENRSPEHKTNAPVSDCRFLVPAQTFSLQCGFPCGLKFTLVGVVCKYKGTE